MSEPGIFNTDQGVQFTCNEFTALLKAKGIAISIDGCRRAFDNIFTERLWRTIKYEEVFLQDCRDVQYAKGCLTLLSGSKTMNGSIKIWMIRHRLRSILKKREAVISTGCLTINPQKIILRSDVLCRSILARDVFLLDAVQKLTIWAGQKTTLR